MLVTERSIGVSKCTRLTVKQREPVKAQECYGINQDEQASKYQLFTQSAITY